MTLAWEEDPAKIKFAAEQCVVILSVCLNRSLATHNSERTWSTSEGLLCPNIGSTVWQWACPCKAVSAMHPGRFLAALCIPIQAMHPSKCAFEGCFRHNVVQSTAPIYWKSKDTTRCTLQICTTFDQFAVCTVSTLGVLKYLRMLCVSLLLQFFFSDKTQPSTGNVAIKHIDLNFTSYYNLYRRVVFIQSLICSTKPTRISEMYL